MTSVTHDSSTGILNVSKLKTKRQQFLLNSSMVTVQLTIRGVVAKGCILCIGLCHVSVNCVLAVASAILITYRSAPQGCPDLGLLAFVIICNYII